MSATIIRFQPAVPSDEEIQRAFEIYQVARQQAERTGNINDMIASGKAFAEFHRLFVRPE